MTPRRATGMTLIEVLVAMSVLAILSVLGYRAFGALLIARERLMETSGQWIDLARLFRRVGRDLARLPPLGTPDNAAALQLDGAPGRQRLTLTVFSPDGADALERIRYDAAAGLGWRSSRAGDTLYPLLPAGVRVQWRLLLEDGRWRQDWPADGSRPHALQLQVEAAGIGRVSRLWSLR